MTRFFRVFKFANIFRKTKKALKETLKIRTSIMRMCTFLGACFLSVHIFACIWVGFA